MSNKPKAYRDALERAGGLSPDPDDVLPGATAAPPAESAAPPPPAPKPARAKRTDFCEFCDAPCRPVPDGIHRCECRNEPTNPKPDHWSLDPKMRAHVIASRRL